MEANIWISVFVPMVLMVMMAGIGLSLTGADFTRAWRNPRATVIGLSSKLVLAPLVGLVLIELMQVGQAVAIGVMLLAFSPGGQTSNVFTYLSRGDAALSVTLTVLTMVVTMVTLPIMTNWTLDFYGYGNAEVGLSFRDTVVNMLVLVVLPISAGMAVRAKFPRLAATIQKPVDRASLFFLFALIVVISVQVGSGIFDLIAKAGPICVLLCGVTMGLSFVYAKVGGLEAPQIKAAIFEAGIANAAFTIVIATSILDAPELSVPAAVYGVVMNVGGLLVMLVLRRNGFGQRQMQGA